MLIATRVLTLRQGERSLEVPIRIFAPVQQRIDWACRFEIAWPDEPVSLEVKGVDAVQALDLALKAIGAILYASEHHAAGHLMWHEPGQGYGFPVTRNIRDMLIGDDKNL